MVVGCKLIVAKPYASHTELKKNTTDANNVARVCYLAVPLFYFAIGIRLTVVWFEPTIVRLPLDKQGLVLGEILGCGFVYKYDPQSRGQQAVAGVVLFRPWVSVFDTDSDLVCRS